MIQIPFLIGAAIGAGATLYMKRQDREKGLISSITDSVKSGVDTLRGAAITTVDTVQSTAETAADTVKSTAETAASTVSSTVGIIKEKNATKKIARESKTDAK